MRSVSATADGEPWVFYEGPPTANGMPGTHHIEARVFKDVFPRYRTMKGYSVERKAGGTATGSRSSWRGEAAGFSGKPDIERYGIAEFNAKCRESVLEHVHEFAELTDRMGYWVDLSAAYRTMDPEYVDSVWWSLQQVYRKGLLVEDHRVAPYCPRCGTRLSDHEHGHAASTERRATLGYVRFPLTASGPWSGRADLARVDDDASGRWSPTPLWRDARPRSTTSWRVRPPAPPLVRRPSRMLGPSSARAPRCSRRAAPRPRAVGLPRR
jgi:isoleucyl-tRNA synthetase